MGAIENADRIRQGYDAFNRGDVPALVDLFADDVVWHFPGASKLGGEHVGRDATLTALGGYGEASGGTLQANLIDIMASSDHVAGVLHEHVEELGLARDEGESHRSALEEVGRVVAAQPTGSAPFW